MRFRLVLLGGSLLEIEVDTAAGAASTVTFGFTGGPRCEAVDIAEDRDPVADKP